MASHEDWSGAQLAAYLEESRTNLEFLKATLATREAQLNNPPSGTSKEEIERYIEALKKDIKKIEHELA